MIVDHGQARLAVETTGEGPPDVLLLHAGVTDQRSWAPLRAALGDTARTISLDRRGYGATTYEPEPGWSPVEDAVAVLDALGIGRATVVGASVGGRTALDLALAHPERVERLVLIGAALSGAPAPEITDAEVLRLDAEGDDALERGDDDALNRIDAALWLDGAHHPGRVADDVRALFLDMNGRAITAIDPGDEEETDAWDRVGEIRVPTLVLIGEHDLEHIHRNARHLAATLPEARLVALSGVAHLPHLEGDATTLHEIAAFIAAGSGGSSSDSGMLGG